MHDASDAFRLAILPVLGHAPEVIEPGAIHRFGTNGRRGDSAGWCKLFDALRGGVFGCFRQQIQKTWSAADPATMTHKQRAALALQAKVAIKIAEAVKRQRWAKSAQHNSQMWSQCVPLVPAIL